MTMGFPVGAQQCERLFGQRDIPVFGTLTTMDMDLQALTIDVRDLEEEGFMEPEAQARDRGEVDLTSSTLSTAGRRWVVCARRGARVCQSRLRTC